jgi:hypothetical protein
MIRLRSVHRHQALDRRPLVTLAAQITAVLRYLDPQRRYPGRDLAHTQYVGTILVAAECSRA